MHLKTITIKGFRNFDHEFSAEFSAGLNVVVGENGAGKTALINAIRQLFLDSESGRYSITSDDFFRSFEKSSETVESIFISAEFTDLTSDQEVAFLPWTNDSGIAVLNLQAENKEFRGRYRKTVWGGESRASQFDPELVDLIQCIYLPPLRDAESKLKNGRGSRLSKLLKALNRRELSECKASDSLHPLEERVRDFNASLAADDSLTIKSANEMLAGHLERAIGSHFGQSTKIQFTESDFTRIVESLTLLFFPNLSPDANVDYRGLNHNSLGYNNLLYIASILAELTLDDNDDTPTFKLLLIEEPEAHLHPQLLVRLLNHLRQVAETDKNDVQVIVTTHSTVLASSVELSSIIHLSRSNKPVATPLKDCDVPEDSERFINRWLDVTKSNLLFASGVILVEGIAEQMLVPVIARQVFKDYGESSQDLEERGVSVINMNGIYFKHFMRLYCNFKGVDGCADQDGLNIPVRCGGITDRDPIKIQFIKGEDTPKKELMPSPHDEDLGEGVNPAIELVETIKDSENARLYVSKYKTLEYDLAMEGNNLALMASVLESLWPKPKRGRSSVIDELKAMKTENWEEKKPEERAIAASIILKRIESGNIGKGFFAQVLADRLSKEDTSISVPAYIAEAVLWACKLEARQE